LPGSIRVKYLFLRAYCATFSLHLLPCTHTSIFFLCIFFLFLYTTSLFLFLYIPFLFIIYILLLSPHFLLISLLLLSCPLHLSPLPLHRIILLSNLPHLPLNLLLILYTSILFFFLDTSFQSISLLPVPNIVFLFFANTFFLVP
jgi:hypothetical protein